MINKTRKQAIKDGDKRYIGSNPCKNGHIHPERFAANGSCVKCVKNDKEGAKRRQETFKLKNQNRLREIKRESMRRSRIENKEHHMNYARLRAKAFNSTVEGKLKQFVKGSLRRCLISKGWAKTFDLVGYSKTDLMNSIECQFKDGMSWDNYGKWHIDHIKPISLFIKEGVKDPSIINALSNLQPLWASENISKGSRY